MKKRIKIRGTSKIRMELEIHTDAKNEGGGAHNGEMLTEATGAEHQRTAPGECKPQALRCYHNCHPINRNLLKDANPLLNPKEQQNSKINKRRRKQIHINGLQGHVAPMVEKRNAYRILGGKS